jgi:hypothetical protein
MGPSSRSEIFSEAKIAAFLSSFLLPACYPSTTEEKYLNDLNINTRLNIWCSVPLMISDVDAA